jgi:hypothetical protein
VGYWDNIRPLLFFFWKAYEQKGLNWAEVDAEHLQDNQEASYTPGSQHTCASGYSSAKS